MIKISDSDYLGFLFKIIERLSHFSFQIKAWEISLVGVMTALLINRVNIELMCIILIVILLFFTALDTFYHTLEKLYRDMYEDLIVSGYDKCSLKLKEKMKFKDYFKTLSSRTIMFFYMPQFLAFVVILLITL